MAWDRPEPRVVPKVSLRGGLSSMDFNFLTNGLDSQVILTLIFGVRQYPEILVGRKAIRSRGFFYPKKSMVLLT